MKILIIGPQASGKGTQADLIAKRLNVPHISTGQMLRQEAKKGSALGKEIAPIIDKGHLVSDRMIWDLLHRRLKDHPEGWVLDGFPRTVEQVKMLDKHLPPEKVVVLEVSDEICIERISGRRICETCGRDYHVKYKPSKREGFCDADGGALVQRADDYREAVEERLADYHAKTEPLIEHYRRKDVIINGDQGIEEVWREIQRKLRI